jgi:hypothetical protein
MQKLSSIAIAAVASLALIAGCGGASGTETTGGSTAKATTLDAKPTSNKNPTSISKAELIKKGDAICQLTDQLQVTTLQKYEIENPKVDQSSKAVQERLVVAIGLPRIEGEAAKLAALDVPEGDEQEVEAIVKGIEAAVVKAEEEPAGVLKGGDNPFDEVDKLAADYGFKVCNNAF